MNNILVALALALAIASGAAQAETIDDGIVAFIKGDGEAGYCIRKLLADKGDIEARYHLHYRFQAGTGISTGKTKVLQREPKKQGRTKTPVQDRGLFLEDDFLHVKQVAVLARPGIPAWHFFCQAIACNAAPELIGAFISVSTLSSALTHNNTLRSLLL